MTVFILFGKLVKNINKNINTFTSNLNFSIINNANHYEQNSHCPMRTL